MWSCNKTGKYGEKIDSLDLCMCHFCLLLECWVIIWWAILNLDWVNILMFFVLILDNIYKLCYVFIWCLTCEHKLGAIRDGKHQKPGYVGGQTHEGHPGVLQAQLHDPQSQQTGQVSQVLSCRPISDEGRPPAQRWAQLIQHVQLSAPRVNSHHHEEAQQVKPQLAPAKASVDFSAAASGRVEAPYCFMVASCEELGGWVWKYRLPHNEGSVQSRGQVGC